MKTKSSIDGAKARRKFPKWVDNHRGYGKEIRLIGDRYYLYEFTPVYNPETKKTEKKNRTLKGRITEKDGLIPKGSNVRAERKPRARKSRHFEYSDDREYGISFWMQEKIAPLYYEGLEKAFYDVWETLVCFSLFRLVHKTSLRDFAGHYSHSYISEMLPNVVTSPEALSNVLASVGARRHMIVSYLRSFANNSDNVIFDGTDIECNSSELYQPMNSKLKTGAFGNGVNIMSGFSATTNLPIYYRLWPGDVKDIVAIRDSYKELNVQDLTMIADKGHCSEKNINDFQKHNLKFILPLKRTISLDYDTIRSGAPMETMDGFFQYMNRHIFYKTVDQYCGCNTHIFLDRILERDEETDALNRLQTAIEHREAVEESAKKKTEAKAEKLRRDAEKELKKLMTRDGLHFTDKPSIEDSDLLAEMEKRLIEGTDEYDAVTPTGKDKDELISDYNRKAKKFGTIALITTTDKKPKQVYMGYKCRDSVEKMLDVLKNVCGTDKFYMQNPDVLEGWMFCNYLALHFYYRLYMQLKDKNLLNHNTPQTILLEMSRVRAAFINEKWCVIDSSAVRQDTLDKINLHVPYGKVL